jgi:phytoene dehydrogenase-like protein
MAGSNPDIIVIGGGLAGLACAREITDHGASVLLLEGSDRVGGRVRTDAHEGFLLDRGFQVLLEAYPELRSCVEMEQLDLRRFYAGAMIRKNGQFHRLADPSSHPLAAIRAAAAPVGSVHDKLLMARLRGQVLAGTPDELLIGPRRSTITDLHDTGFSADMIDTFFRPFLGGVLLDRELAVPARLFRFYLRMFAEGRTSLPALGMEELPRQLAAGLPEGAIRTEARVERVEGTAGSSTERARVTLEDGEVLEADAVVVATQLSEAARLVGQPILNRGARMVTTVYYDAPEPPTSDPILVLDGEGEGPVNHLAAMDRVSERLAPAGRSLVSANVLDPRVARRSDEELDAAVRRQMQDWYGTMVGEWRLLRIYRIEEAVPLETPETFDPPQRASRIRPGLFVAGDHRENPSINGALGSGRRAGRAVAREATAGDLMTP